MTRIPLLKPDLPPFEDVADDFRAVMESGRISNFGRYLQEFEDAAAAYLGTHVVALSSGTLGLVFALQAVGLQPGEKVILPSFTFMATAQAVLYAGGVPVFAEVRDDLTISPEDLAELLSVHVDVGAVIPVHTYGLPCQTAQIQEVVDAAAQRRGRKIAVVFDAAHAFGASVDGRKVGAFGTAEVFSLSTTKVLVCVEGGLISTIDPAIAERVRRMRNYGIAASYNAHGPGLNGKMSEFHAIIGLHNLRALDALLQRRAERAQTYVSQLKARTPFQPMPLPPTVRHTFKDFTVIVPSDLKPHRDRIMAFLADHGIESRAYFFPPVHEQEFFKRFADRRLPVTEDLARRVITLPFFTTMTDEEVRYVVSTLAESVAVSTSGTRPESEARG